MKNLLCGGCQGDVPHKGHYSGNRKPLCESCKVARRKARAKRVMAVCFFCQASIECSGRHTGCRSLEAARRGRAYCNEACRDQSVSEVASATMSRTNMKYASARMKLRNPMHRPEIRAKMQATSRTNALVPVLRGGNGTPMPIPQKMLALALMWPTEYVVPTGKPRASGWPGHYKLDIACPELMVAVEVDGRSHAPLSRQAADARRDQFLSALGWRVLRFSNREVMDDLEGCIQTVMSAISKSKATKVSRKQNRKP